MPNVRAVPREEIQRLVRSEVSAQLGPLLKRCAEDRRAMTALRRGLLSLKQKVAFLERSEKRRLERALKTRKGEGLRFSPIWVKADRKRLGLTTKDYSRLVGVSPQTIGYWEKGTSRPRAAALARLDKVRGLGKKEARRRLELLGP